MGTDLDSLLTDPRFDVGSQLGTFWGDPDNPLAGLLGQSDEIIESLGGITELLNQPLDLDQISDVFGNMIPQDLLDVITGEIPGVKNAQTYNAIKNLIGEGAGTTAYQGLPGGSSLDQIFDPPELAFPEILDFTDALRFPLIDQTLGAIGTASPYDTRRDEILDPQLAQINADFDESRANLENRMAVMNRLGSPALGEQMRKLERDRALARGNIRSQFGMQAAQSDEALRRNRLSDLSGVLGSEFSRTQAQIAQQQQLQQQAQQGFQSFVDRQRAAFQQPYADQDQGLTMMLSGLSGAPVTPNLGAAMSGLSGVNQQAGRQLAQNQQNLFGALQGAGNAFGRYFANNNPQPQPQGFGYTSMGADLTRPYLASLSRQ